MAWEWERSRDTVTLPVGFCRDQYLFDTDTPRQNMELLAQAKEQGRVSWQRKGDDRYFYIPTALINSLPVSSNLFRDTIACVSQMYIDHNYPDNNVITSSLRQIADNMGITFNGDRAQEIDDILAFARFYTIQGQSLYKIQKGITIKYESTFGFIEYVNKEISIDGVLINPKVARTQIKINDIYAQILKDKKLPKAPVPVSALQKANQAPRRLITPTKNLIYNLSALIPKNEVEYSIIKLKEITGYKENRKDRLRKSIENVINQLYPVMISDYQYMPDSDKYIIKYAGQLRPNTPTKTSKSETQYARKTYKSETQYARK